MIARQEKVVADNDQLNSLLSQKTDCKVIEYFRSSSQNFAILFGDSFAGKKNAPMLSKIAPDFLTYNLASKRFETWSGALTAEQDAQAFSNACLIFTGTRQDVPGYKIEIEGYSLQPLLEDSEQGAYILVKEKVK